MARALDTWESAHELDPVARALTLLAAGQPEEGIDTLSMLPIGRRDRALLELRTALFGDRMAAVSACLGCGNEQQFEFLVSDLVQTDLPKGERPDEGEVAVVIGERRVRCSLPDSRAMQAAAASLPEHASRALLDACLIAIEPDGTIDDLTDADVSAIGERLAEVDPDADLTIAVQCADCGIEFESILAPDDFLWVELDTWAQRTLGDVHLLAQHYGWSENEILALSPHRRRYYLEAVGL